MHVHGTEFDLMFCKQQRHDVIILLIHGIHGLDDAELHLPEVMNIPNIEWKRHLTSKIWSSVHGI